MTEGPEIERPDPVESDAAALGASEELDEDKLGLDPLERGVEPAEHWAEANRYGMTPTEQREGEDLDDKLDQEQRDTQPQDVDDAGQLDDDEVVQGRVEELPGIEDPPKDNADRSRRSVADALREDD